MDAIIIFGAQYLIWIIGAVVLLSLALRKSIRAWLTLVISLPVAYALAKLAGHFYSHVQPFAAKGITPLIPHVVDNAFPSDHMLIASVLAAAVATYNRPLAAVLWVAALAVGVARVVAQLHYYVDISASVFIAIVVVAVVSLTLSRFIQQ